jgi:putative tricarboxylic transport membrane protein
MPRVIRSILPYLVGLVVAAALYMLASRIDYTARAGQLGPDTWPKLAIALMAAACLAQIVRNLVVGATLSRGVVDLLDRSSEGEEKPGSHPGMILGGIVLVGVYAALVTTLGFLLATFGFLAAFMYLGRYRNHVAIWTISATATIVIGIVFLRVAYVSLPRGEPPFDRFTDLIRLIPG